MLEFSATLLFICGVCFGQNLERETCDASRYVVDVNMNGADAIIGGLFEIRSPSSGGYACGEPHKGRQPLRVYDILTTIELFLASP